MELVNLSEFPEPAGLLPPGLPLTNSQPVTAAGQPWQQPGIQPAAFPALPSAQTRPPPFSPPTPPPPAALGPRFPPSRVLPASASPRGLLHRGLRLSRTFGVTRDSRGGTTGDRGCGTRAGRGRGRRGSGPPGTPGPPARPPAASGRRRVSGSAQSPVPCLGLPLPYFLVQFFWIRDSRDGLFSVYRRAARQSNRSQT